MARMIDASRFGEILEQWKKDCLEDNDIQGADIISDVILQLDDMPTLTQPNEGAKDKNVPTNEPLTLEQLREMDGQPVWVEEVKHWALIDIEKGGQWDGIPFAVWAENGAKFTYNVKSRGLHCYRRPPEGEGGDVGRG